MNAIAYSSPFVPVEWIAAHGFRAQRLRAAYTGRSTAVARGVCPYVGALIDAAIAGLDASALVLTTVCDQMRYAAALLETRVACPLFLMNVPSTWQTSAASQLYLDELQRLGRFLMRLGGRTPDDADLARVMLSSERTRHIPLDGGAQNDAGGCAPVRLAILGGPLLDGSRVFEIVEGAGGRIVLDATEGGERTMPRSFELARIASNPLRELADAYFDRIPEAFRRPNSRLYEWLDRQLGARRVQGIILRRYLWCDLWHAELQRLRQWSRLPLLEIDAGPDDAGAPNRMQGRIEAFVETLR